MSGKPVKNSIDYHKATSYGRYTLTGHTLDWQHQPTLYKTYPSLKNIRLPMVQEFPSCLLGACVPDNVSGKPAVMDLNTLASVLTLAYGITSKKVYQGQPFYYRSAASAGALYPSEIYLAAYKMLGLEKGLYHYSTDDFSLHVLRENEPAVFPDEAYEMPDGLSPAVTFYISGIFFRSSWKYRARAYRYVLLDAGHVLENLILALISHGFLFSVHYDFNDNKINNLLGLDGSREAVLAYVQVYHANGNASYTVSQTDTVKPLAQAVLNASQVSQKEITYDDIIQIHNAGIGKDDADHKSDGYPGTKADSDFEWIPLGQPRSPALKMNCADSILNRRSRRNFITQPLSHNAFAAIISQIRLSLLYAPGYASCITIGFLGADIEGIHPGFYMLDPTSRKAALIKEGAFIKSMTSVCLDQQWLEHAAVHFLFIADLEKLEAAAGPRRYRHAMMNAGRLGQHIYLASESAGLGCCGIGAFYDNEAKELLGLEGERALLYLVAAGPVKKKFD